MLWLCTNNKLGIIRDYDNQPNAQKEHDALDDGKNICVRTTKEYTLEPEIIKTGNNYEILKNKYGKTFGWENYSIEEMGDAWQKAKATDMLTICKDIAKGELPDFKMPRHIQDVLDFLNDKKTK